MTALALPHAFAQRLSVLWRIRAPTFTSPLKTFSTSLLVAREDTPAMNALRRVPYPSTPPDPSLFEGWSEEYIAADFPAHPTVEGALVQERHPSFALEQLVEARRYAEAEEVRAELVQAGVNIRPHPAYYYAALWVLQQSMPDERALAFANWWTLLPPAHTAGARTGFLGVRRGLFFDTSVDIETVTRFALISASKGYARKVGPWVIGHIARFAEPAQTAQFLENFVDAANAYARSVPERHRLAESSKRWWSLAVQTHCVTGRPEVAFDLVKRGRERGISIRQFAYRFLLGLLKKEGDMARAAELEELSGGADLTEAKAIFSPSSTKSKCLPPISERNDLAINMSIAIKHLVRDLKGLERARASNLVPFFDLYKEDHRGGQAVMELRSRAYRLSFTSLSIVMLAELLHHLHRQEYRQLLYTFSKFFHMTGVPKRNVKIHLYKREDYPGKDRLFSKNLPARIKRTTFNLPEKLWPTSYHTALVWGALVRLAETSDEVERLYKRLSQHSHPNNVLRYPRRVAPAERQHPHYDASLEVGASPVQAYDATHYQWFFNPATPDVPEPDPHQAITILRDMEARGIQPTIHSLVMVAGIQAKHGDPEIALKMLKRVDQMCSHEDKFGPWFNWEAAEEDVEGKDAEESSDEDDLFVRERDENPSFWKRTRLVAHTAVLRGFVDRQLLPHAQFVGAKIEDELRYASGANARTDEAFMWLRALERATDLETGDGLPAGSKRDLSPYLEFVTGAWVRTHKRRGE